MTNANVNLTGVSATAGIGGIIPVVGTLGVQVTASVGDIGVKISSKPLPVHHNVVWFRVNGGDWNNDPNADPSKNIGGYDMSLTDGKSHIPFGSVAAGSLVANFGQSPFTFDVPMADGLGGYNFTAGWPSIHSATGSDWTTFDPSTIENPGAGITDGNTFDGNLGFNTESFTGGLTAFLVDATDHGFYYWEWSWTRGTFFTNNLCMGPFVVGGQGEYSFFIESAMFGPLQNAGGARYHGEIPLAETFTGKIDDDTLTIKDTGGFSSIGIGSYVFGAGVALHTIITAGSGLVWTVSPSNQHVHNEDMTSSEFPSTIFVNGVAQDIAFDAMGSDVYSCAVILVATPNFKRWPKPYEEEEWTRRRLPYTPAVTIRKGNPLGMTGLDVVAILEPEPNQNVTLRYSNDGGASWSNGIQRSAGQIGEYFTDIQWRRLGMARNRIFELSWSGPTAQALTGAMIQYEVAET